MEINKNELGILEAACDQAALVAVDVYALNDQRLAFSGAVGLADVVFG